MIIKWKQHGKWRCEKYLTGAVLFALLSLAGCCYLLPVNGAVNRASTGTIPMHRVNIAITFELNWKENKLSWSLRMRECILAVRQNSCLSLQLTEFLEVKADNFLYIWILKRTHNAGNLTCQLHFYQNVNLKNSVWFSSDLSMHGQLILMMNVVWSGTETEDRDPDLGVEMLWVWSFCRGDDPVITSAHSPTHHPDKHRISAYFHKLTIWRSTWIIPSETDVAP